MRLLMINNPSLKAPLESGKSVSKINDIRGTEEPNPT